jgi:hypothetical protein
VLFSCCADGHLDWWFLWMVRFGAICCQAAQCSDTLQCAGSGDGEKKDKKEKKGKKDKKEDADDAVPGDEPSKKASKKVKKDKREKG